MSATVLDGKALGARIRGELKLETARLAAEGITPGLAVVLVGDDPASQIYVRSKTSACARGRHQDIRPPAAGGDVRRRVAGPGRVAQHRSGRRRHPDPAAAARRDRRATRSVRGRSAQRRRRHPSGKRRPLADGRTAVRRLHAVRRDEADRGGAAAAGRSARRGRRSIEHGRQADGGVAAQRERDRDGLSFQDAAISRRRSGAPIFWSPPSAGPR